MFVWHTAEDATVPVENSLRLAGALSRHQRTVELHVYPRGKHGLGLAEDDPVVSTWTGFCVRFLRDHGW
jgi:predicted esterase